MSADPTALDLRAAAAPTRPKPHLLWWPLLVLATLVGGLGMAMVDGRQRTDTVPGLPWFDELHFVAGGAALAVGVWAFRRDLLRRAPRWHRALGLLYVAGTVLSSIAGLVLGICSAAGLAAHLGFVVLACAWLLSTLLGWVAIRRRRLASHRRWMVRSYSLCSAAITLRLELPLLMLGTGDFEFSFTAVAWLSWLPNLLFAEWWLAHTDVQGKWARSGASPT